MTKKDSGIFLRLPRQERDDIRTAASVKGVKQSEWMRGVLAKQARRDINAFALDRAFEKHAPTQEAEA